MGDRIGEIFSLQEQRVQLYDAFEHAHKAYLQTAPEFSGFPAYRQTVDEITREFTRISQSVRSIEASLHEEERSELAKLVRCLQNGEKKKLELTAELHVSKQLAVEHGRNWSEDDAVTRIIASIRDVKANINEHLEDIRYEAEHLLLGE